ESYQKVVDRFNIARSTLYDRHHAGHLPHPINAPRRLTVQQEEQLILKINEYANRGTLLTPRHVRRLAEAICGEQVGLNWVSHFVDQHRHTLSSCFFTCKELRRLKADKPEVRKAFAFMLQVKAVYNSGLYPRSCIFNMDESPFTLSDTHKTRHIAPLDHPQNGQAAPSANEHITSVACIGINSAPVPPLILYQGTHLQESWTAVREEDVHQVAGVTNSGWNNSHMMLVCLEESFDRYMKDQAKNGQRRLLFLDGVEPHVKVEFLEACWARNIVCITFPANLSDKFQPLNVDFFGNMKRAYVENIQTFMVGSSVTHVNKGLFWGWHQKAWRATATARQMRGAWRKAGLWPLDQEMMQALDEEKPTTPPPRDRLEDPLTPYNIRILRENDCLVRQGKLSPTKALLRSEKAQECSLAETALLRMELDGERETRKLDQVARGSRKRQTYTNGQLFDPRYQEEHAEELAIRKAEEEEAKQRKRNAARKKQPQREQNLARDCTPGPSTSV
ncbi:hypothetical protein TREMEDRAFT_33656, partial [Tremella mesenterica DSM 1558]|uniref:uncharacterized protein n=1 Tax=Tremella mesenterica (strain ATCC 24925 / CBS 8224 / DSM 1558 / NBRC 9311 / NRRL Y-6157 / RJB 2259-6 / UBC 559-6) TaxID=578456 RepID=UPI0003F4A5BE